MRKYELLSNTLLSPGLVPGSPLPTLALFYSISVFDRSRPWNLKNTSVVKLQKLKFIEVYNIEVYVKLHGSFIRETSAKSPTLKLHNVAVGGKKIPGQREGSQLSLHNPALTPPQNEPIGQ